MAVRWFLRFKEADPSTLPPGEGEEWANWSDEPECLDRFRTVTEVWQGLDSVWSRVSRQTGEKIAADDYDGWVPIEQWLAERARLDELTRARLRRSHRYRLAKLVALAAGLTVLMIAAVRYSYYESMHRRYGEVQTYTTAPSQRRIITLADGSSITLAPGTELSTHYTVSHRDIVLEHGEAWFSVAQDRARPYTVLAGPGLIRVLGTQFDVRRERDSANAEHVTVTVSNGTVEVGPPPKEPTREVAVIPNMTPLSKWGPARLVQGQELTVDAAGPRGAVKVADLRSTGAWREGRLEFLDKPLKFVIPKVSEYSKKPIILDDDDDAAGELRFTGTVFEQHVRGWLHALEHGYPVEVTENKDAFVIHPRRVQP